MDGPSNRGHRMAGRASDSRPSALVLARLALFCRSVVFELEQIGDGSSDTPTTYHGLIWRLQLGQARALAVLLETHITMLQTIDDVWGDL